MRYVQQNVAQKVLSADNKPYVNYNTKLFDKIKLDGADISKIFSEQLEYFPNYLPDYRIRAKKNLYLSIYEKTYLTNTLLITIYLLKLNYDTLYTWLYLNYYSELLKNNKLDKDFFIFDKKLSDII